MRTECEECQVWLTLDEWDDDFLVGKECECGYYVTREVYDDDDYDLARAEQGWGDR